MSKSYAIAAAAILGLGIVGCKAQQDPSGAVEPNSNMTAMSSTNTATVDMSTMSATDVNKSTASASQMNNIQKSGNAK